MRRFLKHSLGAWCVCTAIALLAAGCAPALARLPGAIAAGVPTRMRVRVAGKILMVPIEDYVLGAALSEVTPVGESARVATRVYEVQAIIARTYAASQVGRHAAEGFDVCDATHCQVYQPARITSSSFSAVARDAVRRTAGRIVRFGRQPAETLFHADCGGHTTTPGVAWGGPALPYLPALPDDVPEVTHRAWQFTGTTAEWTALLRADRRTDPGGPVREMRIADSDVSGRAFVVEITGPQVKRVSGETLRTVITATRGVRSFMSSRFRLTRMPDGYRADGTGFGHGVGLCQVGAIARARRGDSVESILAHYYPGAR